MRFTKPLVLMCLFATLTLSGCATTSGDKDTMPEWVGDSVQRDTPSSENADAESPADASTLFGFLSKKYLKKDDDKPILAPVDEEDTPVDEATVESESTPEEATEDSAQDKTPPDVATVTTEAVVVDLEEKADVSPTTPVNPSAVKDLSKSSIAAKVIPKTKALTAKSPAHEAQAKAAQAEYRRALHALKSGDLDTAVSQFSTMTKKYPLLSGPVVNHGIALRKQGKLKEAKALLQDALFKKFSNPYLLNELGAINRDLGHFKQAKQAYLSAIRIDNNYPTAHFNLGVLADLYLHDPELALEQFTVYQSLQEEPNKKVKGWMKEIERRVKRMKKAKS